MPSTLKRRYSFGTPHKDESKLRPLRKRTLEEIKSELEKKLIPEFENKPK